MMHACRGPHAECCALAARSLLIVADASTFKSDRVASISRVTLARRHRGRRIVDPLNASFRFGRSDLDISSLAT